MTNQATTPAPPGRHLPWLLGLAALAPLALGHRQFARLFWFGDELDLISQFDRIGFWRWAVLPFAENFVPLFKAAWGGLVYAGNGSYAVMVGVLWLTHAANVGLLARWMLRSGFRPAGAVLAAVGFGLSESNIEALGWTVQWSAELAVTFFLASVLVYDGLRRRDEPPSARVIAQLFLFSLGSAWSFARGVLTGVVMSALAIWPPTRPRGSWGRRALLVAACLLPAAVTSGLIFFLADKGPHHDVLSGGRWLRAVIFGSYYFALNPVALWLHLDVRGLSGAAVGAIGAAKLAVIVGALILGGRSRRGLLTALLLLEAGNTFLMGIGRFEGELWTATSSRYQYCSLLCFMPFLAVCLEGIVGPAPGAFAWRRGVAALLLVLFTWQVTRNWPYNLNGWAAWRGDGGRRLLLGTKDVPEGFDVPGIPFLSNAQAKELVRKYNLH